MLALPRAQLQAIMGCLDCREIAAMRQVRAEWRSLTATWIALRAKSNRKLPQVLTMCAGPALRHFSGGCLDLALLSRLATVAPRLESMDLYLTEIELAKAQTTFSAFNALRRLDLEFFSLSTEALEFPPSFRDLCLSHASPGLIPAALESLTVTGTLHQPAGVVQLCASNPDLRQVRLPFVAVAAAEFRSLSTRLRQSLLTLTVVCRGREWTPYEFVDTFPFADADRALLRELLAAASEARVEMRHERSHGLRFRFPLLRLKTELSLAVISRANIHILIVKGSTQRTLDLYVKLDVAQLLLEAETPGEAYVTKITVPRMDSSTVRTLELYWFAEVRFAPDFVPGRLEEIWLDKPPANMPANAVCRVRGKHRILRFPL